ncbi:MAG: hypothetical protein ACXVUE_16925 [Solirubrobacteraceae bacterium]
MATATTKARATTGANRATTGANRGAVLASQPASMEFLIVEDNGGNYHWTLLDHEGNSLARSPSFASYEHTEDAARVVLAGAGSARLDPPSGNR